MERYENGTSWHSPGPTDSEKRGKLSSQKCQKRTCLKEGARLAFRKSFQVLFPRGPKFVVIFLLREDPVHTDYSKQGALVGLTALKKKKCPLNRTGTW